MEEKFGEFFQDKNYLKVKNYLFNYLNRKNQIKNAFFRFKGKSSQNIRALDIGSGISPVSPIPKQTLFMDLSKEGVEFLKKQGLNAKVGSITKIPEKDNKFDFIFCSEVLEHVKDYKKALKEMRRVLKKDGKLLISVPVHKKYWNVDDEFVEHYRRFSPVEFSKDIRDSGLQIIEEKPIGSFVERQLTLGIVKVFKSTKDPRISSFKVPLIILVNYLLYLIVKASILFSSKESTSIMLYVCKKSK